MQPQVHILLSSLEGYLSMYWTKEKSHQKLADEIRKNAYQAWQNRLPGEKTVRFLQKMPKEHGSHFRFLEITQRNDKTLVVSSRRTS